MSAVLLCDDLMFTSRITGVGRDLGLTVVPVRTVAALLGIAQRQPPACVILDLANSGLDVRALIEELAALPRRPRIIAYGSHVDTASLQAARAAGCDVVLPRSKFVEELATALPRWLAEESGP